MFRTVALSVIRVFHCTNSKGICHTGLLTACEQDQDGLISQIYFWNKTLHVSDSCSVRHQSFSLYTQQWYMSYRFADSLLTSCQHVF